MIGGWGWGGCQEMRNETAWVGSLEENLDESV